MATLPRRFRLEFIIAAALCAPAARAEQAIFGPDGAPTVVQRKLHTMSGRWEAGIAFDVALNNALVDQYGAIFDVSYHPNESLDVGGELLANRTGLSQLARNVRGDLCGGRPDAGCRTSTPKDEFANDNQLRLAALGVARWAPIYGKFNVAGELSVHFQAFLLAGAGAGAVHRESVNLCADPGAATCQNFQSSDLLRPVGELGVGFRFYLGRTISLRSEVRSYFFPSSYKQGNDPTQPDSGTSKRYFAGIFAFASGVSVVF